jgi:hypothetical protein
MAIVPAARGWLWVKRGCALLGKSPFAWLFVSMVYWLAMAILARLPYVGLFAGSLVMPALAVSFMAMCRELDQGRSLQPALLAAGFRRNLAALVALGGLYLAATLAIFAATWVIDGGFLARWMLFARPPDVPAGENAPFLWAAAFALALWFAPVLAAWEGMPAGKALFYSFFASVRNWSAFLVYLLVAGGAAAALAALLYNLHRLQAGAAIAPTIVFLLLVVAVPFYYASLYASYRDVFPADEPA